MRAATGTVAAQVRHDHPVTGAAKAAASPWSIHCWLSLEKPWMRMSGSRRRPDGRPVPPHPGGAVVDHRVRLHLRTVALRPAPGWQFGGMGAATAMTRILGAAPLDATHQPARGFRVHGGTIIRTCAPAAVVLDADRPLQSEVPAPQGNPGLP